jgi:hypothetical protein
MLQETIIKGKESAVGHNSLRMASWHVSGHP